MTTRKSTHEAASASNNINWQLKAYWVGWSGEGLRSLGGGLLSTMNCAKGLDFPSHLVGGKDAGRELWADPGGSQADQITDLLAYIDTLPPSQSSCR